MANIIQQELSPDEEEYVLIPESEYEDQDDYPDDAQILRDIAGWNQSANIFQLLPDDHFEEDETVDHGTLFQDIKASLEEAIAWEHDGTAVRTTILTKDGRLIGPEMMTHAQHQEKLRELESLPATPLYLLGELLKWAGRPAATPEENAEVEGLRHRAEQILKTAGVC